MHSLIFHPSLILSHHLSPLFLFPHIPKEEGRNKSPIQCHFWKNTVECFRYLWKVSDVTCLQEPQHGATGSDRHTCEGQTDKMEHPVVTLPEEAGLEDKSFSGFCRWKHGWRWPHPCANREIRAQKWIPSDSFLPGIRPADSFFLASPSDNFLILKEFPNSGTLCRHLKTGLMAAIQHIYTEYAICTIQATAGQNSRPGKTSLRAEVMNVHFLCPGGWCALPEGTYSISVALPWELQNIPLNQCCGVTD